MGVGSKSDGGSKCEKEWARGHGDKVGTDKKPRVRCSWLGRVVRIRPISPDALERALPIIYRTMVQTTYRVTII